MRFLGPLALCFLVLWAGPAASGPAAPRLVKASSKTRPDWTQTTPERPGRRCFVGNAQKESLSAALDAARQDAWNQAGQAAGAEVSSSIKDVESTEGSSATARTQVAAQAAIHGLSMDQRYEEEWMGADGKGYAVVWVLASMPEAEFQQAVVDAKANLVQLRAGRQERGQSTARIVDRAEALIIKGREQAASGFEDKARDDFQEAQGALQLAQASSSDDPDAQDRVQALLAKVQDELGQKELLLADFKAAVAQVVKAMKESNAPTAVVRATYGDSAFGGPMGPRLVQLVEDELARRDPGGVIPNGTFLSRLSRLGIPFQDLAGNADPVKVKALGVHSVVYVDYFQRPDGVELRLVLQSPSSGVLLAGARAVLPLAEVGGAAAEPAHLDVAEGALASFAAAQDLPQGLAVKLWPDRGESSTYTEGELIVLHTRVDKDCHLYLVHADSDGGVQLLYPNAWHPDSLVHAGDRLDVPAEQDDFQFRAIQPYGAEVIVALATLDPLPSLDGLPSQGFADLGHGEKILAALVKDYLALPGAKRGMCRTVYTTVGAQ
jgi:hypothetical protein